MILIISEIKSKIHGFSFFLKRMKSRRGEGNNQGKKE